MKESFYRSDHRMSHMWKCYVTPMNLAWNFTWVSILRSQWKSHVSHSMKESCLTVTGVKVSCHTYNVICQTYDVVHIYGNESHTYHRVTLWYVCGTHEPHTYHIVTHTWVTHMLQSDTHMSHTLVTEWHTHESHTCYRVTHTWVTHMLQSDTHMSHTHVTEWHTHESHTCYRVTHTWVTHISRVTLRYVRGTHVCHTYTQMRNTHI